MHPLKKVVEKFQPKTHCKGVSTTHVVTKWTQSRLAHEDQIIPDAIALKVTHICDELGISINVAKNKRASVGGTDTSAKRIATEVENRNELANNVYQSSDSSSDEDDHLFPTHLDEVSSNASNDALDGMQHFGEAIDNENDETHPNITMLVRTSVVAQRS